MRVAVLQMAAVDGDIEANLDQIARAARAASAAEARIVVAPELSLTGYGAAVAGRISEVAQAPDSPALSRLRTLSQEIGVSIVLGFPERDGAEFFNSAIAMTPDGTATVYRKCHLYGELEKERFSRGCKASPIITIEGFRIGLLICYDVEFPEWVRVLALAGVDLIAVPTALPRSETNGRVATSMLRTRALENGVFLAYADLCGEDSLYSYQGMSGIVGPNGADLARAAGEPCLLIADLAKPGGDADPYIDDRRPELYASLLG